MDTNKTITILGATLIIMFFGMFWVLSISHAYINLPSEFTITFQIENNTQELLENLNGTIVINNYYGNFTKEITLCKTTISSTVVNQNRTVIESTVLEDVVECELEKVQ